MRRQAPRYGYSNPGFILLAGVIERASGPALRGLHAHARVRPRGAHAHALPRAVAGRHRDLTRVHSYSGDTDEGDMLHLRDMSKSVGDGSIVTTVADLGRWAIALTSDRVLPAAQRAELFAHHANVSAERVVRLWLERGAEPARHHDVLARGRSGRLELGHAHRYRCPLRHRVLVERRGRGWPRRALEP
jgi:CubicO group peptidase (beta-lactamase class C family)